MGYKKTMVSLTLFGIRRVFQGALYMTCREWGRARRQTAHLLMNVFLGARLTFLGSRYRMCNLGLCKIAAL